MPGRDKSGQQGLAGQQGIHFAAQAQALSDVAVVLAAYTHFAAPIPVFVFFAREVGFESVPGAAVSQWAEERRFDDMTPRVVASVQRLVVANAGDTFVAQVKGIVNLQAAGTQAAPNFGQAAHTAKIAVEPSRPAVVLSVVLGAVVVPKAEVVAAGSVVDQAQVLPALIGAAKRSTQLAGVVRTGGRVQARANFAAEWLRADVDHAPEAVAAKARWHRAPVYIDAFDPADGQAA